MAIEQASSQCDQRQAREGAPIACRAGLANAAPTSSQRSTGEQFKRPGEWQIKRRDRVRADQRHVEDKRGDTERRCQGQHAQPEESSEHQE